MKDTSEDTTEQFQKFERIARGEDVPNQGYARNLKQTVAAAEERGRNFQPGYIREINAATARGRAAMEAGKRGENLFPPARMVTGKPHKP